MSRIWIMICLVLFFVFCFNSSGKVEGEDTVDFIRLDPLYGQRKLVVNMDLNRLNIEPNNVGEIELIVGGSDAVGDLIEIRKIEPKMLSSQLQVVFNMKDFPSGRFELKAIVKDTQGNEIRGGSLEFTWLPKELEQFKWIDSKEGMTEEVLAPWIPIKVEKQKDDKNLIAKVWGRVYHFNNSPFPTSIETKGSSILDNPMRIIAKVDGEIVDIKWNSYKIEKQTPGIIIFNQHGTAKGLTLSAVTQVEYDGMIRVDWKITPQQALKLEELTFEISIPARYAKYIYQPGYTENVGFVPKDKFIIPFTPVIWFGDEEVGLEWFCESEKDWYSKITKCIEVLPQSDMVTLRLHLVDKVINLKPGVRVNHELGIPIMQPKDQVNELDYTFGFQATPVKPMEKDAWDYRIAHSTGDAWLIPGSAKAYSDEKYNVSETTMQNMAASGVKTVAVHSQWADIMNYTSTKCVEALKKMINNYHKHGIKVLLYIAPLMSNICPEGSLFSKECLIMPKQDWTMYLREGWMHPSQLPSNVCYRSVWQDFTVDGISKTMMKEYDIDGIYIDGPATTMFWCQNILHGCGYIGFDNKPVRTYQIFANRQMMRRIYAVIKKHKQDGQLNVHQSGDMTIPVLAWATGYWDGEQLGHRNYVLKFSESDPFLKKISLDYFRTEFMGHQWGVAAEFLEYTFPDNFYKSLALSLLHDVPIRPSEESSLSIISPLWKLMDEFGRKQAEWFPYWRNKEYVTVNPDNVDVYVSLYIHPKNGVLMVVSNLGEKTTMAKVKLNLQRLKLKGKLSVFSRVPYHRAINISINNGEIELTLDSLEGSVIWLKGD